jgi:phage/plasmid-like protein (TIGR03299 family)
MAHEIYIDNGRASMMYADEVPWHGLGKRVTGAATAVEAIEAANLDWEVTKLPLYATNGMHGIQIDGKYATVRADKIGKTDCKVFGVVGEAYTPLQNRDAFSFFDTIVKDEKAAIYHTAGALGNGERIWILAKLPTDIRVADDDITNKYLLLTNSHNATSGVQIKFTPIRVVCQNTLTMALSSGRTISVPHYRTLEERLKKVGNLLGIVHKEFDQIEENFNELAKVKMDDEKLNEYFKAVFPDPEDKDNIIAIRKAEANRLRAEYLFDQGKGNKEPKFAGTLWAAYNGVTELIDHRVVSSGISNTVGGESRRLNTLWFGKGAAVKARAYEIALEKLPGWRK